MFGTKAYIDNANGPGNHASAPNGSDICYCINLAVSKSQPRSSIVSVPRRCTPYPAPRRRRRHCCCRPGTDHVRHLVAAAAEVVWMVGVAVAVASPRRAVVATAVDDASDCCRCRPIGDRDRRW